MSQVGGIIPARAGNRHQSQPRRRMPRDHPRACGEQTTWESSFQARPGSSPRVRGTAVGIVEVGYGIGIIPARAGNSEQKCAIYQRKRDHPRACGEQWCADVSSIE